MEYKKLGLTDLEISRIGFGCWAIGGHGYGKVDDNRSVEAIKSALDFGINFFDTADVYGFGHSEKILSEALGSERKNVVIATKFGVSWNENGQTYIDCSPKRVVEALEGSLRRLKLDCIPLYQIHWHDNVTPIQYTMEALKKCQESGKVKYFSCSNFPVELIRSASKNYRIESLQCLYNLLEKERENDMLECSQNFQMGIITYGALARGLLSGKYGLKSNFSINDTRKKCKTFQKEELEKNLKIVGEIQKIGIRNGKTSSQIAIQFVLNNSVVTSVIVGNKTKEQVKENAGALSFKLLKDDLNIINSLGS